MSEEDFIRLWNKADDVHEVARKCRILATSASVRASKLRAQGYRLKKFR